MNIWQTFFDKLTAQDKKILPNVLFEGISWRGEEKTNNDKLMAQRINWCKTLNSMTKRNLTHDDLL